MAILLQQNERARLEVTKSPLFSKKMKKVSIFINTAYLYLSMKMRKESKATKMAQVLSYIQKEVAKAWKDNLLNELSKGKSKVKTVEKLSSEIRNEFGETVEEKKKIEQLRTIEQEKRTCDKYVQIFKKMA